MEYDIYRYPCLKEFSLFSMKQVFKTTLGDVIKLCQILLLLNILVFERVLTNWNLYLCVFCCMCNLF